jgi:trimeric autotransporter adhesin
MTIKTSGLAAARAATRPSRWSGLALSAALILAAAGGAQASTKAPATGDIVSTFAGGVGGPGLGTTVPVTPCGVQFAAGKVLIADSAGDAIRSVSPLTGQLTTPAGTGELGSGDGYSGDGGPATAAELAQPCGATYDGAGNLVIADSANDRVRVVAAKSGTFYGQKMTAHEIYTVAYIGAISGLCGSDDGPSFCPVDVTPDHLGNIVVSDTGEEDEANKPAVVRVIAGTSGTFYGQKMTAGHMYVVAGGKMSVSGDGGPALKAGLGISIGQVVVDPGGNLVLADGSSGDIPNGRIRVVAARTGTYYGQKMTAHDIYTVAGGGHAGLGDGGPATKAEMNTTGVALDSQGNLIIADTQHFRVRVVAARTGTFYGQKMTAHDIYTVAGTGTYGFTGDGGPATRAELNSPGAVTVDSHGNLVIGDTGNQRVRVVAASTGRFYGQAMTAGDIYTVAGTGTRPGYSGDGGPATSAEMEFPAGIAVDSAGNVLIADTRVRAVAAHTGSYYGQKMTAHDIYTVAGGGTGGLGDGGLATKANLSAQDVTVDGHGNLVIADVGNYRIRVAAARSGTFYGQKMKAGDIYTIAGDGTNGYAGDGGPAIKAEISDYTWVKIDRSGNVVISDDDNNRIRVMAATSGTFYGQKMTAADIYTVAGDGTAGYTGDGGLATQTGLSPGQASVDRAGNLVIPDSGNNRIRVVAATSGTFYGQKMITGHIYTIAGNGTTGFSGDGGPATAGELFSPGMLAVDPAGNVLIADRGNNRVRVVAAASGTYYGVVMKAGDIYTIAGNGKLGFSGDGGPALQAEFFGTEGMTTDAAGDLLIVDSANHRVRVLTG